MQDFKVASRYAKSLFDLALEKGKVDVTAADFKALSKLISSVRPLYSMIKSPVVPANLKISVMNQIFSAEFDSMTMMYLELIIRKRREEHIPEIAKLMEEYYNAHKGISKASLTLATELGSDFEKEVVAKLEKLTGKKVELDVALDPALIGGFVLRIDDNQIDTSLRTGLKHVHNQLTQ